MAGRGTPGWIAAAAVLIVGALVIDVARRALGSSTPAPEPRVIGTPAPRPARPPPAGQASQPAAPPASEADRGYLVQLARAETRRRIRASAGTAYLHDFLASSADSMLHRWDNRVTNPVRVHLSVGRAANYRAEFADVLREAFARWEATGVPVRFNLLADSASAEVHIRWRIQFEIERSGQTDLTWNADGHLGSGVVTLATFDPNGRPMDAAAIRVVALHEIGHLLGLEHSPDSSDIMFPVATARDLSGRDIRSAMLLYDLTPGSIR
jgi:hypothetical protein